MLIQNINSSLVNGSVGIVSGMTANSVAVSFDGELATLEKHSFEPSLDPSLKTKEKRLQIPLILAYGLTIHKCQGLTIEKVIIDMKNCFEDGQFYVAVSRATCLENVRLLNYNIQSIKVSQKAKEFYETLIE